jgi:acyl-CoA thioester hydrolase
MKIHRFHSEPMQESWCDAYGHLNEAYYLVPFSNATWIMQDHFGIGVPYFEETGCAILTVETHLRYLSEVRAPATIEVETLMLRSDAKKIWFAHQMVVDDNICATAEFLCLHYNMDEGRTEPMSEEIQDGLRAAEVATLPDWVGRQISLIRK